VIKNKTHRAKKKKKKKGQTTWGKNVFNPKKFHFLFSHVKTKTLGLKFKYKILLKI
jgi:hypothetical protein